MPFPKLSGGSGGGGTVSAPGFEPGGPNDPAEGGDGSIDDDTNEPESMSSNYNDTIDLGQSGPGANQTFDLANNAAAAVETSDEIVKAGGPGTVLAGTQNHVTEINKTVGEVTSQLTAAREERQEQAQDDRVTTTGIPQEVTAARNAAAAGGGGPEGLFAQLIAFVRSLVTNLFGGQ